MGTEGTRIRNRNRRLRKKNLKKVKEPFYIRFLNIFSDRWSRFLTWVIPCYIILALCDQCYENILLYNNGLKTEAVVIGRFNRWRHRSLQRWERYEFSVLDVKYTGECREQNVDSLEIIYLPKNPKINRNLKTFNVLTSVSVYRKITGKKAHYIEVQESQIPSE